MTKSDKKSLTSLTGCYARSSFHPLPPPPSPRPLTPRPNSTDKERIEDRTRVDGENSTPPKGLSVFQAMSLFELLQRLDVENLYNIRSLIILTEP